MGVNEVGEQVRKGKAGNCLKLIIVLPHLGISESLFWEVIKCVDNNFIILVVRRKNKGTLHTVFFHILHRIG